MMMISTHRIFLSRIAVLCVLMINSRYFFSQREPFLEKPVAWADNKLAIPPLNPEQRDADVLVIDDYLHFYIYASNNEHLERDIVYRVNTETS